VRASKIVLGAVLSVALPLCGLAEDAYLYWMIDQPVASAVTFDYARMVSPDFAYTYLTADSAALVSSEGDKTSTKEQSMYLGAYDAQTGGYMGYASFLIELFTFSDGNFTSVAQSEIYTFAGCASSIGASKEPGSGGVNTLKVSTFTIPEPTGGMLVLLGFAVLGLKRKKF